MNTGRQPLPDQRLLKPGSRSEVLKSTGKGKDAGDRVQAFPGNANTYGPYGKSKDKGKGKRNIAGGKSKGKRLLQGIGTQALPGSFMSFECDACETHQALYCNCCATSVPRILIRDGLSYEGNVMMVVVHTYVRTYVRLLHEYD